jgi:hypothetical protein
MRRRNEIKIAEQPDSLASHQLPQDKFLPLTPIKSSVPSSCLPMLVLSNA